MGNTATSRRRFLWVALALVQGALLASPKAARTAKHQAKTLLSRLERERFTSSMPKRNSRFESRRTGEAITLYRKNEQVPVCTMNRTGGMIWEWCDGSHRPTDIQGLIARRCQVGKARAEEDVLFFLAELERIGAIRI